MAIRRRKYTRSGKRRLPVSAFAGGVGLALVAWLMLHHTPSDSMEGLPEVRDISIVTEGHEGAGAGAAATGNDDAQVERGTTEASPGNKKEAAASPSTEEKPAAESKLMVKVYLSKEKRIESVKLESYVRGVVAAEMPTDFESAALEAQAIAARTYLIRRLWLDDKTGVPVRGADVTDTVTHQVYRSEAQMDKLKQEHAEAWSRVDAAVRHTQGLIMTYQGAPIESLYFASSNGYTENSQEVFALKLPYLQSVSSPWDKEAAPQLKESVELTLSEFYRKLGVRTFETVTGIGKRPSTHIDAWTEGHRVRTATVGGKTFTGDRIRKLLGLRSAAFDWTLSKSGITITTYGSGHGVGMSQWGAEGMAQDGATAEQIIAHYYTGVAIMEVSKLGSAGQTAWKL